MIFPDGVKVFGDLSFRDKKCPKEDAELGTFVNQVRKLYPEIARVMLHIPNEGQRRDHEVGNLKRKGALNPGASDIIIPGCPSFIMEMKRKDHTLSKWQPGQIPYLKASVEFDSFTCVALGWESGMAALGEWISSHYPQFRICASKSDRKEIMPDDF